MNLKNIFKQKPIIEPTKEMLESSIRNNLRLFNILSFIFFGFLTIYAVVYIRTQTYAINLLLCALVISVFQAMYFVTHKIDKARLEIWKGTHEEVKE